MNIIYEDIILRAVEEKDMDMLLEMMNDPAIEKMTGGYSFPISYSQQMKWFQNSSNTKDEIRTVIYTDKYGAIGSAILTDIDWKNRTAQFHIKILNKQEFRGKGFGQKTIKAMIKYAFEQLDLYCIESRIVDYNQISMHIHEKCGFKKEGVLRSRMNKNGARYDINVMSILRGELSD